MASKMNRINTFKGAKSTTAPIKATPVVQNTKGGGSKLNQMARPNKSGIGPTTPESRVSYEASRRKRIAMPILANPAQHDALVKYLRDRLTIADDERQRRVTRITDIDKQLSGFIKHDPDDKKRARDNANMKAPKPPKHNLTLAAAQIDEGVTYLMSVFAPEMDIFTASSSVNKQPLANGLTQEVNNQGQRAQYYRNFCLMCLNALKYNFGGLSCQWETDYGYIFKGDGAGQVSKKQGIVWQGNLLKSIDPYNFFFDPSVHPVDLARRGEFYAEATLITAFRALKMENDGLMYGTERFVNEYGMPQNAGDEFTWYEQPPQIRELTADTSGAGLNWQAALQAGDGRAVGVPAAGGALELVYFTCWITPSWFGLSPSKELELWRIGLVNNKYITYAIKMDDTHGMLPCAIATPLEDGLGNDQRTYAEQLIGLQHYGSFLINTDQDATRKSLYGFNIYNPNAFPGLDKAEGEMLAGNIPLRSTATGIDIDKVFRHYNAAPETTENMNKLKAVMDVMQKIMPTNMLQQVADLERATLYQAAATVQAGNRRNLKIARLIYDQCLMYIKIQMLYNIYANMSAITYINEQDGSEQQISPADLVESQIELDVGTGIKGIDKLMQLQIWERLLNAIIQSPQALGEFDIVKFLTFFASLAGDKTDLAQFRRPAGMAQIGPDGKPIQPQANPGAGANAAGGAAAIA